MVAATTAATTAAEPLTHTTPLVWHGMKRGVPGYTKGYTKRAKGPREPVEISKWDPWRPQRGAQEGSEELQTRGPFV